MTESTFTTTNSGEPVASDAHSQSVGNGGPIPLHDHYLVEKLAQFNREKVPERIVHAKGGGAFGTFTTTGDVSAYTRASLFQPGAKVEMLARFSTVAGEQGSPDTWRDPRGFALKFYTDEGNYDLVGNNTPVFFIRDGIKFPDFIHSQKRLPGTHLRNHDMQWDFWTLSPESAHQVTWLMGDRGLPASWRTMDGFGSHTYQWINAEGERFWVKYHFKSNQGNEILTQKDADQIAGEDADFHIRDLSEAIARGEFPSWTLSVQVMPYAEAAGLSLQPVRPHQGVAAQRLPAHPRGRDDPRPQPGELLRADRAGHLRAVALRAGNRREPRQDAPRPHLQLRRRPPLPRGHEPRAAPGERSDLAGEQLLQRRCHAPRLLVARDAGVRAELVRWSARGPRARGGERGLGERRRTHPSRGRRCTPKTTTSARQAPSCVR